MIKKIVNQRQRRLAMRTYHQVPLEYVNRSNFHRWIRKTDSCWIWTRGGTSGGGPVRYGLFNVQVPTPWGRATLLQAAHRIAFALAKGQIPEGMEVLHSCDNPRCVRPSHLRAGTAAENAADKMARGRHRYGAMINTAKLTSAEVLKIRRRYAKGAGNTALAEAFGIRPTTVKKITGGSIWRSVGGPVGRRSPGGFRWAKLTVSQVKRARRERARGASITALAKANGVAYATMHQVISGKTWRHLS